jgi:hypothetical protein
MSQISQWPKWQVCGLTREKTENSRNGTKIKRGGMAGKGNNGDPVAAPRGSTSFPFSRPNSGERRMDAWDMGLDIGMG